MAPGGLVSEGSLTEIDTAAAQQSVIVVEGNVLSSATARCGLSKHQ